MKGLELCRKYFFAYGLPMLEHGPPEWRAKVAAGLVGDGSECYGYDDQTSRDHDWGPGFCLWLPREDMPRMAPALHSAYDRLPGTYEGFGPRPMSRWGEGRTGVFEIQSFFARFIGYDRPPETHDEWLVIPENALAAATNGEVFFDPPGEFTRFREALAAFYPEDVRKKKIASRCMTMAQAGQYNFPRSMARKEWVAARYAETKFVADAISMAFLLNRAYTPFYKWMHRALADLPILGGWLYGRILELVEEPDPGERERAVEDVCARFVVELGRQGLSRSESGFLADHGPEVQATIEDPALRERNVWVG
ncbi:MAG: DUF4037 domain-containing protein [Desulfatibacillaceae bacterium]